MEATTLLPLLLCLLLLSAAATTASDVGVAAAADNIPADPRPVGTAGSSSSNHSMSYEVDEGRPSPDNTSQVTFYLLNTTTTQAGESCLTPPLVNIIRGRKITPIINLSQVSDCCKSYNCRIYFERKKKNINFLVCNIRKR